MSILRKLAGFAGEDKNSGTNKVEQSKAINEINHQDQKYCKQCGSVIAESDKFCGGCIEEIVKSEKIVNTKAINKNNNFIGMSLQKKIFYVSLLLIFLVISASLDLPTFLVIVILGVLIAMVDFFWRKIKGKKDDTDNIDIKNEKEYMATDDSIDNYFDENSQLTERTFSNNIDKKASEQKHCKQCGSAISESNKFCVNCGTEVEFAEKDFNIKNKISDKGKNYKKFIIIIASVVVFFVVMVVLLPSDDSNNNYCQSNDLKNSSVDLSPFYFGEKKPLTTNPAYLASPEAFFIDDKNKISDLPEDGKSVWVEEILDGNTIKVSYIILKGGEAIITFRNVDLAGLRIFKNSKTNCGKIKVNYGEQAMSFLEKFIKNKYVYLETPLIKKKCFKADSFINENDVVSGIERYITIWKQDIDIKEVNKIFSNKSGEDQVQINFTLIYLGYGKHDFNSCVDLIDRFKNEQEVAEVANRGLWGICDN